MQITEVVNVLKPEQNDSHYVDYIVILISLNNNFEANFFDICS